ncbi:DivIVA domain-containing protein [Kribbella sp. CA-294648]|uniref:DivIVA domain-containing protein n=1 Tax=Kribbella sp. CA-294648 TaxID=3239948 RepID=UPI003D8C763B
MRGLDSDEVFEFLDRLADQVQAGERELAESQARSERLLAELQRTRSELQAVRTEVEHYEEAGDRVNEQVVQMFSQAQLVVEEMVQDVSRDARERISQARAHERKIVAAAMDSAGDQVREYAQTAQAQMQSIVNSFATEVDQIATPPAPAPVPDPLFDREWQTRFRSGSDSP